MAKEKIKFVDFLEDCGIVIAELPKVVTVAKNYDEEYDMIQICVEGIPVQGGHYGDIYDGCVEHPYIGDYENENEFMGLLYDHLTDLGYEVKFETGEFSYYED